MDILQLAIMQRILGDDEDIEPDDGFCSSCGIPISDGDDNGGLCDECIEKYNDHWYHDNPNY